MAVARIAEQNKQRAAARPAGGPVARSAGNARLAKEIRHLERDTGTEGGGPYAAIYKRAVEAVIGNPFVGTVLDIVSRPNYAIAGVVEEIASTRGYGSRLANLAKAFVGVGPVAGRVRSELFSGIAGAKGQKKGFGEVFQDLGYGEGGSLSGLAPFAFSETGEGVKFQRGGFFDWTARGATGLALDIAADPTTYLTFGTAATGRQSVKAGAHYLSGKGVAKLRGAFDHGIKQGLLQGEADAAARAFVARQIDRGAKHLADQGGIKLFGVTVVPGEVLAKPARNVSDAVVKYLDQTTTGRAVLEIGEGVGRAFNRDHVVRKIPEYVARKQDYLTGIQARQRDLREMVEDLYRGTTKDERVAITNFIDSGGKTAVAPHLTPLVKKTADLYAQFARVEQEMGLLEQVRLDYVFHAYDASPKRLQELHRLFDPNALRATLRGSQKERAFDTLEEARKFLAAHGVNPIEDSAELLMRRGLRHIHATETKQFFDDVAARWGARALDDALEPGAAQLSSEINAVSNLAEGEVAAVEGALRPRVPIDEVRKLSDEGKREFLRRRFDKVGNARELENVMNKYREFEGLWPETTNQATRALKAATGERMATLDLPEFKGITMPTEIAQDIRDFNKHFIDPDEVGGLLRAYDKFMNTFKVGVTSIFPAFHARNAYSNVVQQFTDVGLSALNPKMHDDAVRMLAGDVNGSFLARHGRRWGYSEVVYEAKRRGIIADYRNIFETFGDKIPIRTGKHRALDFVTHPVDTWKRFGGIIENEGRLSLFTNYLRRGLDPQTAAQRVNKALFDYKNLSRFERDVLARLFPFYRWTRKNIALQAERLAKNPGQAATQAKLTRENRTDPTLLPSYLRGDFVFTMEADDKGNLTYVRGLDLPISDLNAIGDPLTTLTANLVPLVKVSFEVAADQDFFRKRKISETSTPLLKAVGAALDMLPQRAKNAIDFSKRKAKDGTTEYRMNPTLAYVLIKSWALARVYGTAERLTRAKSMSTGEKFLDMTTGFRLQDVDVDTAARTLEFEYRSFLERKALAMGARKRFSRTFKPKGQ